MDSNSEAASKQKFCNRRARRYARLKTVRFLKKILPPPAGRVYIRKLHRELWEDAAWNTNFIVFTISACLIATFGLISNSTAVIIGAMLVAPLMLPLRALAFGAIEGDFPLFRKGLFSVIGATILAFLLSYGAGQVVDIPEFGSEVLSRTQPTLIDLAIAIVAGGISAFAKVRSGVSDALAGTAIAVALMPPLCVVGLAASQDHYFWKGASLLYLTNLLGITLACMIVYVFTGYTEINRALGWTLFLTTILILPLGASFIQLVRQARLNTEVITQLRAQEIIAGDDVNNTQIEVDWTQKIPIVYITLQTDQDITRDRAISIENSLNRTRKKSFKLVFFLDKVTRITTDANPLPPEQLKLHN